MLCMSCEKTNFLGFFACHFSSFLNQLLYVGLAVQICQVHAQYCRNITSVKKTQAHLILSKWQVPSGKRKNIYLFTHLFTHSFSYTIH